MNTLILIVAVLLVACCGVGDRSEIAVRSALNVLADVVSPASKLAKEGCDAKEGLVLADVRAGKITATEAGTRTEQVREGCDAIRKGVNTIRSLHEEASAFVEAGNIAEAQHRIDAARAQFRDLMLELQP